MKNKIIFNFLLFAICFLVTGCGKTDSTITESSSSIEENTDYNSFSDQSSSTTLENSGSSSTTESSLSIEENTDYDSFSDQSSSTTSENSSSSSSSSGFIEKSDNDLNFSKTMISNGKEYTLNFFFIPTGDPLHHVSIYFDMTIHVVNNKGDILQILEDKIITRYFIELERGTPLDPYYQNDFLIADANFDGEPDIIFPINTIDRGRIYGAYLWNPEKEQFWISNYDDILNPEINPDKKYISSHYSGGEMLTSLYIYEFIDGEFICTKSLGWGRSSPIRAVYIVDSRLINGNLENVFDITLYNYDDAAIFTEYFDNCHDWDEYFDPSKFVDNRMEEIYDYYKRAEYPDEVPSETIYIKRGLVKDENLNDLKIYAEIPNYWIQYNKGIYPVHAKYWKEKLLHYEIDVYNDMIYDDNYILNTNSTNYFPILKPDTQLQIEPEFRLSNGTGVYYSSDVAEGETYHEYTCIIDSKLVKIEWRTPNDPEMYNQIAAYQASEEDIIHLLDTLEFR